MSESKRERDERIQREGMARTEEQAVRDRHERGQEREREARRRAEEGK